MFIQGTKDPFGSIEELQDAIKLIPAPTSLVTIEGARHDLLRGRFDFARLVVGPFLQFAQNHLTHKAARLT